ncbi:MAG: type II secretion system protein GspL [Gammaproteobacteria bacterium]|nr:type II secretion system protein GspL [Gammaproteobacteria bacterium]
MAEQLVIRLNSLDADSARWLVLDARGNRIGFPQSGRLADIPPLTTQRRVIVLLPGEDMPQLLATVPGRNRQQIARAAPYAIEDRVAGDIDELFVAVLDAGNTSKASRFVVVERQLLESWTSRLHDAGIEPDAMLPDHAALPEPHEQEAQWWFEGDRLLVRDTTQGFAAPASDADLLLKHLDEDVRLLACKVGDATLPAELPEGNEQRELDADRAFTELATEVARRKDGGLLQQEYTPQNRRENPLMRWRNPAMAAAVLAALALTGWGLDVYRLQQESEFLDQQMQLLFQRAMPGSRFDPATAAAQMRVALRGNESDSKGELLQYLEAVGSAMNGLADARFTGFSFRDGRLEVTVSVKDARTLETLQAALRERTRANVQLQSANSEGDRLEGRILLEGGSA